MKRRTTLFTIALLAVGVAPLEAVALKRPKADKIRKSPSNFKIGRNNSGDELNSKNTIAKARQFIGTLKPGQRIEGIEAPFNEKDIQEMTQVLDAIEHGTPIRIKLEGGFIGEAVENPKVRFLRGYPLPIIDMDRTLVTLNSFEVVPESEREHRFNQ